MFKLFKQKNVEKQTADNVAKQTADSAKSMYEEQNAKALSERYMSPFAFVQRVILPIIQSNRPVNTVNRDAFRQKNNEKALKDLEKGIWYLYIDKLYSFKKYNEETPYNKMLMWGALLVTLNEIFFSNNKLVLDVKKIDATEYNKLPKRYRGAFRKSPYNPNTYIYTQKNVNKDFNLFYDPKHPNYKLLNKDIRNLFATLYQEEVVRRTMTTDGYTIDDFGNRQWIEKIEYSYGIRPCKDPKLSNRISDEQMEAMAKLQDYFATIASMCIVTKPKYGSQEIFNELNAEKSQENIFVKAQNLTKMAKNTMDTIHKTDELCTKDQMSAASKYYSDLKKDILWNLRIKIK